MWLASDGGVFENRTNGAGWQPSVDGLHTQHVQSLDVVLDPSGTRIGYATQDNDAWVGKTGSLNVTKMLGDTNWSSADAGGPDQQFFYRSFSSYVIVSLNNSAPAFNSLKPPVSIIADPHQPDRPGLVEFIQSVPGETSIPLDAVSAGRCPVRDNNTPPMPVVPPASLSGVEQPGNPWLLRNRVWTNEPDFYRALSNGNWQAELKDLPAGTEHIYVSEGHTTPHYFALVRESSALSLYEYRINRGAGKGRQWIRVFQGVIDGITPCQPFEGWYGPGFVDPYDSSRVFLLSSGRHGLAP